MKPNFFIKYHGPDDTNDSEIDLVALGESIVGFDRVIKDIFYISKINGDISVSASKTQKGSLVIDIVIAVGNLGSSIPFDKIIDFLNFLKVVDQEVWAQANTFFGQMSHAHDDINEFARQYPATYDLVKSGITLFIGILIGRAGKHKKCPDLDDLPKKYAIGLHKMIKQRKFKKAFKPFIENEVTSIEVSYKEDFIFKSTIDVNNFDTYLSEGEEILPQFTNGETYNIVGKIVGMQCSRGDSMNVKLKIKNRKYITLVALPPEGKTTKDYDDFYGQDVIIKAVIQRDSLYQKPRIFVESMELQQQRLI
ncbi:MAG: hypothetical protein JW866_05650 [Ignavibacteriales bacterium]|nr:hypothetical protein [Ignavibacteriales bacterium]